MKQETKHTKKIQALLDDGYKLMYTTDCLNDVEYLNKKYVITLPAKIHGNSNFKGWENETIDVIQLTNSKYYFGARIAYRKSITEIN